MSDVRPIRFGAAVQSTDGPAGTISGVAVDPGERRVVHLIVEPKHDHPHAHLVPVDLIARGEGDDEVVTLTCTVGELPLVETALRPGRDPQPFESDADWTEVFHAAAQPAPGFVSDPESSGRSAPSRDVGEDVVPAGEVELRQGTNVDASDYQPVGQVGGFEVDADWNITALDVEPRHLHRDRRLTVPIADVAAIEPDIVRLALSVEAVRAL